MKERFIGTWELVSLEARDKEGNKSYPYGKDISGILVYNDSYMITIISGNDRPKFTANDLMLGTNEEKLAITNKFVSYTGTYEIVDKKTIAHNVLISFFPNWVGDRQIRYYTFDGNILELSTAFFPLNGKEQQVTLVWNKK